MIYLNLHYQDDAQSLLCFPRGMSLFYSVPLGDNMSEKLFRADSYIKQKDIYELLLGHFPL